MDLIGLAKTVLLGLLGTAICKGILLFLRRRGIRPERWIAAMIQTTTNKVANEQWIAWIGSGLVGIFLIVIWDVAHVDALLDRILSSPPPDIHVRAISTIEISSSDPWMRSSLGAVYRLNGEDFFVPITLVSYLRFYNDGKDPAIVESLSIYISDSERGPWRHTCPIDIRGKRIFLSGAQIGSENDVFNNLLGKKILSKDAIAGWVMLSCDGTIDCGDPHFFRIELRDPSDRTTILTVPVGQADRNLADLGSSLRVFPPNDHPVIRHVVDPCTFNQIPKGEATSSPPR